MAEAAPEKGYGEVDIAVGAVSEAPWPGAGEANICLGFVKKIRQHGPAVRTTVDRTPGERW